MCKIANSRMTCNQKRLNLSSKVLHQLVTTKNSCVEIQKNKKHLALLPYHMKNLSESIKEILDEDIAKFNRDVEGIVLGYKNIKLLTEAGVISGDSSFIHLDIQADFVIFKPVPGNILPGVVVRKTKNHVACLVYHTFNVSLPKPDEIVNWTGNDVEVGQEVMVRVTYTNLEGKLPYIKGEFLNNVSEPDDEIVNKITKFEDSSEEHFEEPKLKEKKKKKRKREVSDEEIDDNLNEDNEIVNVRKKKRESVSR
ncbi:hypothetical protein HHI36_019232 [Cryptolaemus montrouzieri]|uniref:DNA-directed RNA polymerase I subunit RPA43 n=1 Tax=Cryptolaemus montrouzieri TaxID=559131 RepID=A0ABD2P2L0_9CUCU